MYFLPEDMYKIVLPTAQWLPRGYIFPLAAAGLWEQDTVSDATARTMKSVHSGPQQRRAHSAHMLL